MTRGHRAAHRLIWLVLAPIVAVGLAVAWQARREPVVNVLPADLEAIVATQEGAR